ncbi:DarT ssDNA thymidine ADP-ribosyltransferase family protein [Sphingopyxis sp. P8]|uniref:DarT ssDNA thymidine ADP-ribosyltransferase family protein n=1 Tax=Sphingopyxis sp. P8 TaxID=2763256 RepID=UPI001D0B89C1|nr:DarT ssDNA thymidine ADP-ribosyltransferase family protein [Sphingopyxis sp. P8]
MALSAEEADAHILEWERKLDLPYFSHRSKWPSRLFHHAPLENAVQILSEGVLRSRADPDINLRRNVAGDGVIDARVDAHEFVRLYFRPRTPTQFHIEGIRKRLECEFGHQAPILIMFVLKARPILTRLGTRFSNENMQRNSALVGDDAAFFAGIPWEKVYHEGGLNGDHSIIGHRCAEVLATSPLDLNESLDWIYCRSEAERDTLLYFLGDRADDWRPKIRVSDDIRVFNRLLAYVEHVHLSGEGAIFEIHPRNDSRNIDFRINIIDSEGVVVAEFVNDNFRPIPPNAKRWRVPSVLIPGTYLVKIWIEDEIAFEAPLMLGDDLV